MTPTLTARLCNIALKPGISASTNLITTRRILRNLGRHLDEIRDERRAIRRKAGELRANLPFTRHAVGLLEQQANEHREAARAEAWQVLAEFGTSLMFDREGFADTLGFDRMCDLLSVNPVHRKQAHEDGDASLRGVAYVSRLEDSSAGHSDDWGAGGPVFRACHAAMIRFIRQCPEDQLPDPFGPGAPFGPKARPELRIVGT